MLHDHSGFLPHDTETKAAIAAIAPTVAKLLDQRAMREPSDADDHYAWSTYIGELEAEIATAAAAVGLPADDLIAEAQRVLRRRPAAAAAQPAPPAPKPDGQQRRRLDLDKAAGDNVRITREMQEIDQQIAALLKQQAALAKAHAKTRRLLYVGRGRG